MLFTLFVVAGYLAANAFGASSNSSALVPPSRDPFYTAPHGFQAARPGQVLRMREAPGNLTTVFNESEKAYNVLFRTTDSNYMPSWAVTTFLTPKKAVGNESQALLSYQLPYNSPNVDNSPSYALHSPRYNVTTTIQADVFNSLRNGWVVNIPDFEGPLAAYGCAVQEGHAVIDSIRAVLSLSESRLSQEHIGGQPRVAIWGYSSGSVASEFATELQVQYAPELKIAGAALGGLPANQTDGVVVANKGRYAGLGPLLFLGWSKQHLDFSKYLRSKLKQSGTPYNASTFFKITTPAEAVPDFMNQDIFQFFTNGKAFLEDAIVQHITNTDTLIGLHGVPQVPLFIYKAIHDELAPVNGTDMLVDRYCQVGASILYQKNTIGGHIAEEANGNAAALAFLESVLGGTYSHIGCTVQTTSYNTSSSPE